MMLILLIIEDDTKLIILCQASCDIT